MFLNLWTPVAVGAGNTALRAEANISVEGNQKQSHFLLSLEFSLVAKKKITQLESDIRSCQRKNFSLKQASGLSRKGGGGGAGPPGPTPWIRHSVEVQDKDLGASFQTLLIGVRFHLR